MKSIISTRAPVLKVLVIGGFVVLLVLVNVQGIFLLLGIPGLASTTVNGTKAFFPDSAQEINRMSLQLIQRVAEAATPLIDASVPSQIETATFALG